MNTTRDSCILNGTFNHVHDVHREDTACALEGDNVLIRQL